MKPEKRVIGISAILILIMILLLPGCMRKKLTEKERMTLSRVYRVASFAEDYYIDNWQCPRSFRIMVESGFIIPINPYTGKPMFDTGTKEFDPDVSPGNFYYAPVKNNKDMVTNFSIYVFGERGVIKHIRPSPMAPT